MSSDGWHSRHSGLVKLNSASYLLWASFMGLKIFQKIVFALSFLFLPFFTTGCLTPVKNEISLATGGTMDKPADPNDTRLVIFNDSDFLAFGMDGSGRINVKLNGQGVTQIRIGQYAQVIVPQGKYHVELVHFDTATFSSEHEIELNTPVSFLEIYATPTSNRAFLVSRPPPDFDKKFKLVKQPDH